MTSIELGLGLIGIGRPWPDDSRPVRTADEARALLEEAVALGIRTFDTAPAYGLSELRLGEFLTALEPMVRSLLTIASKAGEFWDPQRGSSVDHSIESLERSLASTLNALGPLDVLLLHKCEDSDLQDEALLAWLERCRCDGTAGQIGITTSSPATLRMALDLELFNIVQFPANSTNTVFADEFLAQPTTSTPYMNRPMASGQLAGRANIFGYHVDVIGRGVVLTGASTVEHLRENVNRFLHARAVGG